MRYRELGKSGLSVSEIGFGGLGIGGVSADVASYGPTDDHESLTSLVRARELGITFYDTSPDYGNGKSERLIGEAFASARANVIIASKVGFVSLSRPNDTGAILASLEPDAILRTLEGTLERIGSAYLDLLQLHSPPIGVLRANPKIVETLRDLVAERLIRTWGVSLRSPADGPEIIREFAPPVIQVNFNLIDQRSLENGLLDAAAAAGIGVVARTPLAYGFLTGRYKDLRFDPRDQRTRWSREQQEIWAHAPDLFAPVNEGTGRTMAQLALLFCLSHPAVSTVIVGMMKPAEVDENAEVASLAPLTADEISAIIRIYRANEFFKK